MIHYLKFLKVWDKKLFIDYKAGTFFLQEPYFLKDKLPVYLMLNCLYFAYKSWFYRDHFSCCKRKYFLFSKIRFVFTSLSLAEAW